MEKRLIMIITKIFLSRYLKKTLPLVDFLKNYHDLIRVNIIEAFLKLYSSIEVTYFTGNSFYQKLSSRLLLSNVFCVLLPGPRQKVKKVQVSIESNLSWSKQKQRREGEDRREKGIYIYIERERETNTEWEECLHLWQSKGRQHWIKKRV